MKSKILVRYAPTIYTSKENTTQKTLWFYVKINALNPKLKYVEFSWNDKLSSSVDTRGCVHVHIFHFSLFRYD